MNILMQFLDQMLRNLTVPWDGNSFNTFYKYTLPSKIHIPPFLYYMPTICPTEHRHNFPLDFQPIIVALYNTIIFQRHAISITPTMPFPLKLWGLVLSWNTILTKKKRGHYTPVLVSLGFSANYHSNIFPLKQPLGQSKH